MHPTTATIVQRPPRQRSSEATRLRRRCRGALVVVASAVFFVHSRSQAANTSVTFTIITSLQIFENEVVKKERIGNV